MRYLIIVFLSGFVVMSVELIASRIVAPIIGSSIFTWTSIIGVILLGISIGNYAGGRLIDKCPHDSLIANLLISASIFIAAIPLLTLLAQPIVLFEIPFVLKILLLSTFLFFIPAMFLGTIYPSTLRLYITSVEKAGENAGLLSALGALGSILGTFSTGFFFIGFIGSAFSLHILSWTLFLGSLWFGRLFHKKFVFAFIIIAGLLLAHSALAGGLNATLYGNVLYETESKYYKIRVVDGRTQHIPARILFLDLDSHSTESQNSELIGTYQEIAPLFRALTDTIEDALIIGGGSYNLPKSIFKLYRPNITVVEIDPEVTKTAEKFFDLTSYPIESVNTDGRLFLSQNTASYDIIFQDAFNSFISVPWHLATLEAHQLAKQRLNPGGIYILNIIAIPEGEHSELFDSVAHTFSRAFPNYYAIYFSENKNRIQNVLLVGINAEEKINEEMLRQEIAHLAAKSDNRLNLKYQFKPTTPKDAIILKDDFAPMERLIASIITNYSDSYIHWIYNFLFNFES